jgi:hypothetical protein
VATQGRESNTSGVGGAALRQSAQGELARRQSRSLVLAAAARCAHLRLLGSEPGREGSALAACLACLGRAKEDQHLLRARQGHGRTRLVHVQRPASSSVCRRSSFSSMSVARWTRHRAAVSLSRASSSGTEVISRRRATAPRGGQLRLTDGHLHPGGRLISPPLGLLVHRGHPRCSCAPCVCVSLQEGHPLSADAAKRNAQRCGIPAPAARTAASLSTLRIMA